MLGVSFKVVRRAASLLRGWLAAIAVFAALLGVAAPAGAAIKLRFPSGFELAEFSSLRCKVDGRGFTATGKDTGWRLTVRIYSFDGFHTYHVDYGAEGNADFFARTTSNSILFSNVIKPEIEGPPELTLGGGIGFPGGKGKLGIGYALAYRAGHFDQQASLVGRAPCSYPRPPRGPHR